jgi:hypothetical protein
MIKAIILAAAAVVTFGLVGCSHPTTVVDTTPPPADQTVYQNGYSDKLGTPHHHRRHHKVYRTDANG